ncbi:phage integrase SAM-like domain-containing protein [Flavobacterium humidisoli]|uniref:phage integrase SAM-like domain-containing protein n=1 Tax=Flavobacterium humidisoli TaxID=2937442 RepID=UPI003B845C8F
MLSNFIKEEYHKEDLGWKSVSSNFINNLELFLRYQSTFKGHIGIRNNSTVKYMRMYKTAFNYALKSGLIEKNPFDLYQGKVIETDAVYLTPTELKTIEITEITAGRLVKNQRHLHILLLYRIWQMPLLLDTRILFLTTTMISGFW